MAEGWAVHSLIQRLANYGQSADTACCLFLWIKCYCNPVMLSHLGLVFGFPGGSGDKESVYNAGDLGSIPGLGKSHGGGHGNPLQYSCLENPHGQRTLKGLPSMGSQRVGHDWVTKHTQLNKKLTRCFLRRLYHFVVSAVREFHFVFSSAFSIVFLFSF